MQPIDAAKANPSLTGESKVRDEDELEVILERVKRRIEIGLLARNRRFLEALAWEIDDELIER